MKLSINISEVAPIFAHAGWRLEHVKLGQTSWAAATRVFPSAGGARTAVVYLEPTGNGGIRLHGTYVSAGEDVLAAHSDMLQAEEISGLPERLSSYLEEATHRIEQSWGRRILRLRQGGEIEVNC